jgi:hypothetical protein
MKKYFFLQIVLIIVLIFHNQIKAQEIYASIGGNYSIYVLNPTNCSSNLLCNNSICFVDIAYEGGVLYGTDGAFIYTIDTITGTTTTITPTPIGGGFNGLTGDGEGHLYASSINCPNTIYKYDIALNIFSQIGVVNYSCEGDIVCIGRDLYMTGMYNDSTILIKMSIYPFSYSVVGILNIGSIYSYGLAAISNYDSTRLYVSIGSYSIYQVNENTAATTFVCNYTNFVGGGGIAGMTSATGMLVGESEINFNNKIFIYPNPSVGFITIQNNNHITEKYILTLRTLQGQQVMFENINLIDEYKLDLNNIEKGIYFLTLQNNSEQLVKKIMIE